MEFGKLPPGQRILLTGVSGQVGGELADTLMPLGEVVAPTRTTMDLADVASVRKMIQAVQPRWIVNPGAYTAVDRAESEPQLAYAVNAEAVQIIGEEARAIGAGVIHFSTDYVFDGLSEIPYVETDATGPTSVYGASKLAGEKMLLESGVAHIIFRTGWVYGTRGKNFLKTILKFARERETLRVVADQFGAPTWSRDLARMTAEIIGQYEAVAKGLTLGDVLADSGGIYHATGAGETTWHGFATEAVRLQREREPGAPYAEIVPISTEEFPTPAKRPANSRLQCGKLAGQFGWKMMDWQDSLRKVLMLL
ncbi:dTDP-4-dehydrorhamnose reductase [Tunturiibacter lichenicola]|uniref:dTDP-4-dehydrorhamnose reductase n=1 Tax=Tunturiibacter lichenicola TaxID=2051959 RepID=UPI0021B39238|nr:dTDP-4-dehydrorhamnose reductase [Edaphobacter lichenicola]